MLKRLLTLALLFCLFQAAASAQVLSSGGPKDASTAATKGVGELSTSVNEFGLISQDQPIGVGGEIYRFTKIDLTSNEDGSYLKSISDTSIYTYTGFRYNRIEVLGEHKHDSSLVSVGAEPETEEKVETEDISLDADEKKQAWLEIADGKKLLITVVDENNRITARE
ncbi:hypothetical protein ACFL2I_03125 [Candidatus Omnitrophota bacterium]